MRARCGRVMGPGSVDDASVCVCVCVCMCVCVCVGEAHARAISRVMGLGSVDDATAKRLKEEEEEAKKKADVLNAAYYGRYWYLQASYTSGSRPHTLAV